MKHMSVEDSQRDGRPSPEALLAVAKQGGRGRLKVFLGAAPGVGKTYAMLQAAQARLREGIDAVVGIVETHGRQETEALLKPLEVIPRQQIEYRGTRLQEMDLDAVLARRPELVLVDELAHTNAPGSRHPKRFLDVEELIASGIDVYTTVNVQHIESLNDAILQITGVRVRETLPDRLLEKAHEIQLIDLAPEELIQRLNEGKVYVPDQAQRAIQNYFRPGNLNALRELALRRTAQRVDVQMQNWMKAQAIPGPWPTTDRIMVCVSPSPYSPKLVRAAKRRADGRNVEWMAVYVETPSHYRLSETERDRVDRTLRMAEQLGGEAVTIPGQRPADDLIRYAQSRNVTEIVIGKSSRSWWQELRYGSLVGDLIRRSGQIDVHVIRGEEPDPLRTRGEARTSGKRFVFGDYVVATLATVLTGVIAKLLEHPLDIPNVSIIFLLAVLFSAVRFGLWPSLYASALSALIFNFFFINPLYTFTIASPQETLAFFMYFVVAVIASHITARMREQAEAARVREDQTRALFGLSRAIAATSGERAVAQAVAGQIAKLLQAKITILLPGNSGLHVVANEPSDVALTEHDQAAAVWAFDHNQPTGNGSDTLPGIPWFFMPLQTAEHTVGVLGVESGSSLSPRRRRLMEALADQAAVGIERARLRQHWEESRVLSETEKLRSALLSSISHDLRTPLASIIGSASSLLTYGENFEPAAKTDLLETIQEEAERLNRFVGNLLDMTRLESGKLELRRDWAEAQDMIGAALARLSSISSAHTIEVEVAPDLPLLRVDFVLMEQVLVNLLDNAGKFSEPSTTINIRARRQREQVLIEVTDQGIGVSPAELEDIFDKFHRVRGTDRQVAGTGLGLSICRGIVEAHGGTISASTPEEGKGLTVTIRLPIEEQPPPAEMAGEHQ